MTKRVTKEKIPILFREFKTAKEAFRDIRNYLAGQFVGATRDDILLDEVLKCLFCKLYEETGRVDALPEDADSVSFAKHIRSIFICVRKDFPDIYKPNTEILLDPDAITFILRECGFPLLDATTDPIGDAFEVFAGSEGRGRAGQFFTPRLVTDLLVEAVAPQPGETVIDPACGACGFLTSVARYHLKNGMTANKLVKEVSTHFFGIDKDEYLTKLGRLHLALLSGGHANIHCADSIAMQNESDNLRNLLPKEGFDVLLTNPPFGVRIVAAKDDVLRAFQLARKWHFDQETGTWGPSRVISSRVPPQVLFIERSLSLIKEGGRLGMVVPESLLSNKSYRYVMEFLQANADVQSVIGMPEALFKTSGKGGTHTKTCVIVATKISGNAKRSKSVFMAEARFCGHDSRAKTIPLNDIPTIQANLKAYEEKKKFTPSTLGFLTDKTKITSSILSPRYYDPELNREFDALRATHELLVFGDLVEAGILTISTGIEPGKLAYGTGDVPFIRTSDISNWEIKADYKHGVDRKIFEVAKKKQDVREGDLLMVKDGTYLVGTCAMVTRLDQEIIFQSHLYKIRVQPNDLGLNSYLLLALLSSPIVQRQVKSKQFTQDIIDSLGGRINELVLPLAKDERAKAQTTDLVRKAVEKRVEARELAKEARATVCPYQVIPSSS